jgi:hypothetical protein
VRNGENDYKCKAKSLTSCSLCNSQKLKVSSTGRREGRREMRWSRKKAGRHGNRQGRPVPKARAASQGRGPGPFRVFCGIPLLPRPASLECSTLCDGTLSWQFSVFFVPFVANSISRLSATLSHEYLQPQMTQMTQKRTRVHRFHRFTQIVKAGWWAVSGGRFTGMGFSGGAGVAPFFGGLGPGAPADLRLGRRPPLAGPCGLGRRPSVPSASSVVLAFVLEKTVLSLADNRVPFLQWPHEAEMAGQPRVVLKVMRLTPPAARPWAWR